MEDVLKVIQLFRKRLQRIRQKEEIFLFDIAMVERTNLVERLDKTIERLKNTLDWEKEEKLRKMIQSKREEFAQVIDNPNDHVFLRAVTALSNNIKHLLNRIEKRHIIICHR